MSQSETVTVRLAADVKKKLEALAKSTNRSKSWSAAEAITASELADSVNRSRRSACR